jgi:hypothetical protein
LAARKGYVCDGQPCNWTLWEMHLQASGFVAILDILHLLGYLYAAAGAAAGAAGPAAWRGYQRWLTLAWSGRTTLLLAELQAAADRLGPPPAEAPETDPRRVLAETLRYVNNNQTRMDYPRYRKLGLPLSSAPVESVVKQYNRRIKGSEKFWLEGGVEAMPHLSHPCWKLRRKLLPSMATSFPPESSTSVAIQRRKTASKASGSSTAKTRPNVSWLGMPCGNSRKIFSQARLDLA